MVLGVTGSPGSGKSTLTDALIATLRARGQRVAATTRRAIAAATSAFASCGPSLET